MPKELDGIILEDEILEKIKLRKIRTGVIGLGYVGLPLAVEKAKSGFLTTGFDVIKEKVDHVNNGFNYIGDVVDSDLAEMVKTKMLSATSDYSKITEMDFIAICVPTPLDSHQQPDTSYIESSAHEIGRFLKRNTMVVLESTTYPGTTEELVKPILEKESGLMCGKDFYLGFSPERVDPGNMLYKTKNTPKVVGAIGEEARMVISKMYEAILGENVHVVSSPKVAEMTKILENTYRNINIGLINELAILSNRMGIDIWEVIDAAKTKPFGFTPFYPGPGLGGHCIPLDPYYLSWKAREYGFHTSMIESSMMINDRMPEYTVERCGKILNRKRKSLFGAEVLVLGIAYKQDIDDYRESPALRVIIELEKQGANVRYFDPYIPEYRRNETRYKGEPKLSAELLKTVDIVVITTAHTCIDYSFVQQNAVDIFDTKNAMKNISERGNIEKL